MGLNLVHNTINLHDDGSNVYGYRIKDVIPKKHLGFDIYAGGQINKYIALEAFIQSTFPSTTHINILDVDLETNVSSLSYGFDNVACFSIDKTKKIIGMVGLGYYVFNEKMTLTNGYNSVSESTSHTTIGYRVSIGGEYEVSDNVATRFTIKYVALNHSDKDVVTGMLDVSFGLKYMF